MTNSLTLKPGREKSVLRGHPWIFSGAIERVDGSPQPGTPITVLTATGQFVATAAYSPKSQIRARVLSMTEDEAIDSAWVDAMVARAVVARHPLRDRTDAIRLVHGEGDGLPGVVVDQYGPWLVGQFLTAFAERNKAVLVQALCEASGCEQFFERSDVDVRKFEGLPLTEGVLRGTAAPQAVRIVEDGISYEVDIAQGHKTGFYIDQRENRKKLASAALGDGLNCFCYTGGFSLAGALGGARSVLSVDSSADALAAAARNAQSNGPFAERLQWDCADVFKRLRELLDEGRRFDWIVLDPPKFAATSATVDRAARAYKDINLLAMKLLNQDGRLMTFSCSGAVSLDLFHKIVAGAAADAQADMQLLDRLGPGTDHPVRMAFPEGDYLKGLWLRKIGALR